MPLRQRRIPQDSSKIVIGGTDQELQAHSGNP